MTQLAPPVVVVRLPRARLPVAWAAAAVGVVIVALLAWLAGPVVAAAGGRGVRWAVDAVPADVRVAAGLAAGTLASEDLACVAAGQLVAHGRVSPWAAVAGCFVGIYVGDLGLWVLGRALGRGLSRVWWLARRLPADRLEALGRWFDRHAGKAIVAARFLPGTRLPLYVAAGALGRGGGRFAVWTLVAAAVWVPAVVLLSAGAGHALAKSVVTLPVGWAVVVGGVAAYAGICTAARLATPDGRSRLAAAASRLWRWEFWPAWLFYAPIVPYIVWQSIRRGGLRGFASVTAANPGIPHGGFVGESKHQILASLDPAHVLPFAAIPPGPLDARIDRFHAAARDLGLTFPLVLKPDVGQRGAGVRVARSVNQVTAYLHAHAGPVIVQAYHPGPFEAGVFYYRLPGEPTGRILSITDKRFPEVVGDGASTVRRLVLAHRRYRMQAGVFLARLGRRADRVPAAGERVRLGDAGNHCQGALFLDGAHLITPALEARVDAVARSFPGFYFGRFDVRYADADAFRAGRDFAVVELNGVTSESTNLYDPSHSLWRAYGILRRQWQILFQIADENCRRGHRPTATRELARLIVAHFRQSGTGATAR